MDSHITVQQVDLVTIDGEDLHAMFARAARYFSAYRGVLLGADYDFEPQEWAVAANPNTGPYVLRLTLDTGKIGESAKPLDAEPLDMQ
ncbi:hypothetical protein [Amycolatopsis sp. NPDC058986]|uniref:hypothetical protein n=1 Tax=Actinomycetes TaxID=1760 RepID=UPI003672721E